MCTSVCKHVGSPIKLAQCQWSDDCRCRRKLGLGYSQPSDGAAAAGIDSNGSKTADSDASGSASGGGSGSGGMSSEDEELFQDVGTQRRDWRWCKMVLGSDVMLWPLPWLLLRPCF